MTDTDSFLKHVLPDRGMYAIAIFKPGTAGPSHYWTTSLQELAAKALEEDALGNTVYHACASYRDRSNRKQANALGAKALWLDVDAGAEAQNKNPTAYKDATEAYYTIEAFCRATGLPSPTYVASGTGLHVYWVLAVTLAPPDWKQYAERLKRLCASRGLHAGPERTADIASILRPPGTHHRKAAPKLVECGELTGPYEIARFGVLLDSTPRGENQKTANDRHAGQWPALAAALAATFDRADRFAEPIADSCAHIGVLRDSRGRLSEPLWYACLGVLAYCRDGEQFGHLWSSGYDGYTYGETRERLDRARRLTGATTCEHFHSLEPKTCEACQHWEKIKSPISLGGIATTVASIAKSEAKNAEAVEPPRPLMRELPPADPFPAEALGSVLAAAARAIHDRVRAPLAICGQSVLAAATLVVQGHANVRLPTGHEKPLSNYFVSVAATGERKSAVDQEALWPVHRREAVLREASDGERLKYENEKEAWETSRKVAIKNAKSNRAQIKAALDALGPAPLPPLVPIMTCGEPTYEGLCKLLAIGLPSVGIFAAEGGQFVGGHGMSDDAKLRTAAGLSALWDGEPIKRVRALDGFTVMPGRRVAVHLMAQPDVAAIWFGDRLLEEQGLLSRTLVTAPDPTSGDRMWREPMPESDASMKRYGARLLSILERPFPVAPQTRNELAPRMVPLSSEATADWVKFHDHVERRLRTGGEFEPVRGLANKLPEHAARVAAVLTLVENFGAGEVGRAEMEAGIALAQHYAVEAMRLFGASRVSGDLREAHQLLTWLHTAWAKPLVSLPDIYQRGPNAIRDKARARGAVNILSDHGWLVGPLAGDVDGTFRREVWRIVEG